MPLAVGKRDAPKESENNKLDSRHCSSEPHTGTRGPLHTFCAQTGINVKSGRQTGALPGASRARAPAQG